MIELYGVKNQEEEELAQLQYEDIREGVALENELNEVRWRDCFSPQNKMLYRTLLGMTLQSLQQLTGLSASDVATLTILIHCALAGANYFLSV